MKNVHRRNRSLIYRVVLLFTLFGMVMGACDARVGRAQKGDNPVDKFPPATGAAQNTTPSTPEATAATVPETTPTPQPLVVYIPGDLPPALKKQLVLPEGMLVSSKAAGTDVKVSALAVKEDGPVLAGWVYALVAPFPTLLDDVRVEDLRNLWRGGPVGDLKVKGLIVDRPTRAAFEQHWGPAAVGVDTVATAELLAATWKDHDMDEPLLAVVPFEQLDPRWKVIAIDGQSPLRKEFDPARYALTVRFGLKGDHDVLDLFADGTLAAERITNREAGKLTTVMLTGVTALVRGTASKMEVYGNDFPAEYLGDTLREADILHINNEIPFWTTCPEPHNWPTLTFCSRTKYMELLELIGTDVVELSGDHLHDWGDEAILLTLEMYQEEGWKTYGGGADISEGRKAARFEHNGNKIAFLGCSAKSKGYATASDTTPGAALCDFDLLVAEIKRQKADGYLPIVTFQHLEYYQYGSHPILEADFQRVAKAGAVIVSGSQAHQPHTMAFNPAEWLEKKTQAVSFLHYGLGNLFFDQIIFGVPTSQAFLDRHIMYDGRYISTELLTTLFVDTARARFMTEEERRDLLTIIFTEGGW